MLYLKLLMKSYWKDCEKIFNLFNKLWIKAKTFIKNFKWKRIL